MIEANVKDEKKEQVNDNSSEVIKKIDAVEADAIKKIKNLYDSLNEDKMDFDKIKNAVESLQAFNSKQEYNYLSNLLYPERCKGVKIPTPIPVPSCSFQLHNCITLSTNTSGNLGMFFNPFYLGNKSVMPYDTGIVREGETIKLDWSSSLWVNNDDTLTGSATNNNWWPKNIGQDIPGVYDQYRLVSASLVVKYIGRLDIVSGVIGGAIIFDELNNVGFHMEGDGTATYTALAKYGNFDLAMDSFYHQENLVLEGVRELYFPLDNSFEEYIKLNDFSHCTFNNGVESNIVASIQVPQDYYKSGFNFFIYVLGAPASSACFKVDIYCNFECLPNAQFLNYMPLSMSPMGVSNEEKRRSNLIVQQKPVMKLKDGDVAIGKVMPSIWDKLRNKFAGNLPSIKKLVASGLVNYIPGLKGGLSLAGTMLNSYDKMYED